MRFVAIVVLMVVGLTFLALIAAQAARIEHLTPPPRTTLIPPVTTTPMVFH